jgi:NAD-dependent dihydropyrimidine dehydrogenase PreA subunit
MGGYIMSEKWYPIVDVDKCNDCRMCYDSSECGVFEVVDDRVVVAYPEECIWECTKCGDKCPKDCIQYEFSIK